MDELAENISTITIDLGLQIQFTSLQPSDQGEWLLNYFNKDNAVVDDEDVNKKEDEEAKETK